MIMLSETAKNEGFMNPWYIVGKNICTVREVNQGSLDILKAEIKRDAKTITPLLRENLDKGT